jgi:2-polyprenyl-6-hydroxyphenyl methylase/3-demethylubiquinone-9 3-methyltransferase
MPVDNALYDARTDIWWDETQPLSALKTAINPGRMAYMQGVLEQHGWSARGRTALDVGCGGGIMAEEVAALGFKVTGVDPSENSLATARRHAAESGLDITYVIAGGESVPYPDASFDLVYCCDVLEHVDEVSRVISEAARVLKPDGIYLYDTINRTAVSRFVMIKLFQEWRATAFMPAQLHDWSSFIKPSELEESLELAGLRQVDSVGLKPSVNPVGLIRLLRELKRGRITPAEMGRLSPMVISGDRSVLYAGHAMKGWPAQDAGPTRR